jgi:tRNA-2-methylthio-N6-dimethylallyladenosine synthase
MKLFKNSFIFKYSARPGTKGDELFADDVPEEVKKRRNNELLAIQNQVSLADHVDRVGQSVEVLVEGPSKAALKHESATGPRQLTGRTRTDHIVVFEGHERLIGQLVQVAIEEATAFTLFGRVVTAEKVGREHNDSKHTDLTRRETQLTRMGLPLIQAPPL